MVNNVPFCSLKKYNIKEKQCIVGKIPKEGTQVRDLGGVLPLFYAEYSSRCLPLAVFNPSGRCPEARYFVYSHYSLGSMSRYA